jgi:3-hydroxyacyl-[acyl-carrier-protein] dehydratase
MSIDFQNIDTVASEILKIVPQQHPFLYIDSIREVDEEHIVGSYKFKDSEWFYQGHFPGRPITPGVILIETMAQTAVVAFGIFLMMKAQANGEESAADYLTLFTDVQAEFIKEVPPGSTVVIKGEKKLWRRRKLRAEAQLFIEGNVLAATATLAGIGVRR